MSTPFAWGLALLLAGCGGTAPDQASGSGGTAPAGSTNSSGTTGGAGSSSGSTGGAGGSAPAGSLCPEVTVNGWSCTPNNYHDPEVSFVAQSGFIFLGTVTALDAATPGIDVTDTSRSIVVHVDQALYDPGMLDVGGQSVTVFLLAAPTMPVGYQGYFFTSVSVLGQTVGVSEIAHADTGVYPTLPSDVPGIEQLLSDEELYARMQTAGSVVVGTVTAVTALPDGPPVSEHDPVWARATIAVDCTLWGATPAAAQVAFATSGDVAWYQSPKLTLGQAGVFLLQPVPTVALEWKIPRRHPVLRHEPARRAAVLGAPARGEPRALPARRLSPLRAGGAVIVRPDDVHDPGLHHARRRADRRARARSSARRSPRTTPTGASSSSACSRAASSSRPISPARSTSPSASSSSACAATARARRRAASCRSRRTCSRPIEGEDVLIVEDIVDTGLTIAHLLELLRTRHPASVKVCALLHKPARTQVEVPIDYLGFTIEDRFVVGYGLDWAERYRNLPFIGVVEAQ